MKAILQDINMKLSDEDFEKLEHEILTKNKMLYCMHSRSCIETCMCWGLEIQKGWINIVDDMSKSLEALNYMFYPKFRVRVQMDQLKSKYATLHAYFSVVADPPKWMCIWHDAFQNVFDRIARLDFKKAEVLDRDAYDEVVEKELATKEEFEKEKKFAKNCSNVEVFEKDGKFIKKATYERCKQVHYVATKHKALYWLLSKGHAIENWPMMFFNFEPSYAQKCIHELLEEKANAIVQKAEKDCYEVCEHCGHCISDESDYSPRCTTRGWIAYLCQDCADKTGQPYIMNGSVWQDGKEVMSKKEYAKEKADIEERFKKAQKKLDDED